MDTCAAEFESFTPYLYSTYEEEDEADATERPKIAILGSGPNRIGQGIEFDYCCCHASFALREDGYETIMVNCNPETVSTDYDTSDRLYFEPLTLEDVLAVMDREKPQGRHRAIWRADAAESGARPEAQRRSHHRHAPESIDLAEDRRRFGRLLDELGHSAAAQRHRAGSRRGRPRRQGDRFAGAGAAQLRAGRPRHGHRLRSCRRCRTTSRKRR